MVINATTTIRKVFHLPRALWQKIEDIRFGKRLRSEAETLRYLISSGLEIDLFIEHVRSLDGLLDELARAGKLTDDQVKRREEATENFRIELTVLRVSVLAAAHDQEVSEPKPSAG